MVDNEKISLKPLIVPDNRDVDNNWTFKQFAEYSIDVMTVSKPSQDDLDNIKIFKNLN